MRKLIFLAVAALLLGGSMARAAEAVPYDTYTYTYGGDPITSPHAFVPGAVLDGVKIGTGRLDQPSDLFIADSCVYISDTGNNRILVLDEKRQLIKEIKNFSLDGKPQRFNTPLGLYVTSAHQLFVADSHNKRIVRFNEKFACTGIFDEPGQGTLPQDFNYIPSSVAVDAAGRIYVLSTGSIYGVMVLNTDGSFVSFLGAQRVTPNLSERFWRLFMSEEQKRRTGKTIPTNFSNLTLDTNGFLYLTAIHPNAEAVAASMISRSKDTLFASVKKLNFNGDDILKRNGFFPPGGDVKVEFGVAGTVTGRALYGPSTIVDIAVAQNGCYSIADQKRNKIFTYDPEGNLLHAFGGTGYQHGVFEKIAALDYDGSHLLVLDTGSGTITELTPTEYGELIGKAIDLTSRRRYEEAVPVWQDIVTLNTGFDFAYIGIANAYMREGRYQEAMACYKNANDVANYSKAFGQYRRQLVGNNVLFVFLGAAVLCLLLAQFFKFARKFNTAHHPGRDRYGLGCKLMYGFHTIFRPSDGFWDIKHEKRADSGSATIVLAVFVASMLARSFGYGYIFNTSKGSDVLTQGGTLLLVIALWCVANWCLTSLMNGEGSFRDIYITTAYSLLPASLMNLPAIMLSHVLTAEQGLFLSVITAIGFLWSAFLLFSGTMSVHGYSIGKNTVTSVLTLAGMVLIAFLGFLFINLLSTLWTFILNIYHEVVFRL